MVEVGARATLKMFKSLLKDHNVDRERFRAEVIVYSSSEELITLKVEEGTLTRISLDGIYRLVIKDKEEVYMCEGTIKERFQNDEGNIIVFHIENGFYKNF